MKFLKVTAWVTGITLAVLAVAGWVVTSLYEDEVKAILLQRINDRLATEVQVQQLELSIWKTFPYAALEFNGITADEYQEESAVADTLFHFDQLYLQFSLKDLWKEDYRIEKVLARGGFLDLRIEANGADNYHIWKPSSDTSSSREFLFELENVTTENVRITYRHLGKEEHFGFDAEEATLSGRFSDTRYELAITATTGIRAFRIGKTDYGAGRDAELSVLLDIDREADTYTIREGELVIDDLLHFGINGALLEDGLDLTFTGDNLDLLATRTLLPATVQKPLENYRSEGVLDFELRMVGAFSRKDYPAMTATFGIRNGAIEHRATGHELTGISLNGSYTNGKRHRAASSRLEIDTISARLGEGTINGRFVVQNFERPQVRLDAQTAFALEDWRQFLNLDRFEALSGQVEADVQYTGKLKAPDQLTADDLDRMKGSGTIRLQDAHFVLKGQDREYRDFSGTFRVRDNNLLIEGLQGTAGHTTFQLDGLFRNMLAYALLPDERLVMEATLEADSLNLDQLLETEASGDDPAYALGFPEAISFNLQLELGQLRFRRFRAQTIRGIARWQDGQFRVKPVTFQAMEGKVRGELALQQQSSGNYAVTSTVNINHIDLRQLFYELENFGQGVVLDRHLKGFASADIRFASQMDTGLNINTEQLYALADLTVEQGELIGFEPLEAVSENIRENKIVSLFVKADSLQKKLDHIRFSSLSNQIEIKDQTVHLPYMKIRSSALNINVEGTHTFEHAIDYRMNFRLKEVLTRKHKKPKKEYDYLEEDEEGGTRLFLTMTGTVEDPVIKWERPRIRTNIKKELKKESRITKGILNEEFGWFKNDSTIILPEEEEPEEFIIEWEEDPESTPDPDPLEPESAAPKSEEPKKKNKLQKWLDKLEEDEQQRTKKKKQPTKEDEWLLEDDDY